jgi:transcriptional regulator with XRE-family HTH domain
MQQAAGERLTKWREDKKLTQSELAAKWGVSQPFLSQIENGSRSPNLKLAAVIERDTDGDLTATSWVTLEREGTGESSAVAGSVSGVMEEGAHVG